MIFACVVRVRITQRTHNCIIITRHRKPPPERLKIIPQMHITTQKKSEKLTQALISLVCYFFLFSSNKTLRNLGGKIMK